MNKTRTNHILTIAQILAFEQRVLGTFGDDVVDTHLLPPERKQEDVEYISSLNIEVYKPGSSNFNVFGCGD